MSARRGRLSATSPARLGGEGGGELFVEGEEVFEAVALGVEAVSAVAGVDGAVEGLVGAAEGRALDAIVARSGGNGPPAPGERVEHPRFADFP